MKKFLSIFILLSIGVKPLQAQYFNNEVLYLHQQAVLKNDTLALLKIQEQLHAVDIKTTKNAYLPKVSWSGSYTRLNDDIVFPENLQGLLMGTQSLLIKEKLGLGFNTALPAQIPLQAVDPIQHKNIWRSQLSGQWMLFSGMKVSNGIRAYEMQKKVNQALAKKHYAKLWLEVSEVYDQMALVHHATHIIDATNQYLDEQKRFVESAISNGLATPLERKQIELAIQELRLKKDENQTHQRMLLHKMHQLTGVDLEDLTALNPVLLPVELTFDNTIENRPELAALQAGIEAVKYQEKAALSEYIPKIAAFGQYEFREKDLSMLDPQWVVGIKLQWNIFDGFTAKNQAKKANLQKQQLEIQHKATVDKLDLGYKKFKEDFILAQKTVTWKESTLKLREESYDLINKKHKNGLAALTDVLQALSAVEKAKFEKNEAEFILRRISLQAAELQGNLWNNY